MKLLGGMTFGARLSLLVGVLILATTLVGGSGIYAVREAQRANTEALQVQRDLKDTINSARSAGIAFRAQTEDFRYILLRGHEPSDHDRYLAAFKQRGAEIDRHLKDVGAVMARAGMPADGVEDARRMHGNVSAQYLEALKAFDPQDIETIRPVDQQMRGKNRQLEEKLDLLVTLLQLHADSEAVRLVDQSVTAASRATVLLGGAAAVLVLLAAGLGFLMIRSLRRAIGGEPAYATEVVERIARGDLETEVSVRKGDSRSLLAAMRTMQQDLRALVGDVALGARSVADTSAQIAQGNLDLSQRTEEQASTLEETASSMEELSSTVTQNADNAREATGLANAASRIAVQGGEEVGRVVSTMQGIAESSRRIADIIGVIDGIAFQTNILALNAAVEAARAGEQGRGFAVVAAEVRNLAQRSAAAAKEIKGLIGESVGKVDEGTRLVGAAGKTMNEIVDSVEKVSLLITEIAAASQEQRAGLEQVNTAVTQMDAVVQQNASMVEEAAAATDAMKDQAGALVALVSRFRIGADSVELHPLPPARQDTGRYPEFPPEPSFERLTGPAPL